jgi:predicted nucleic acid-binding protein
VISVVTVEEILEGAVDEIAAFASLQRRASRRMGENDAWLVATAHSLDADVVGADRIAFERLGARYLRFR